MHCAPVFSTCKIISKNCHTITNTVKNYKPGTTAQNKQIQMSNQVQRYHTLAGCPNIVRGCNVFLAIISVVCKVTFQLQVMSPRTSHVFGYWNRTSEQRSFTAFFFVRLICWRTFVCVLVFIRRRRSWRTDVPCSSGNHCPKSSSAPWHAQYQVVEPTHGL